MFHLDWLERWIFELIGGHAVRFPKNSTGVWFLDPQIPMFFPYTTPLTPTWLDWPPSSQAFVDMLGRMRQSFVGGKEYMQANAVRIECYFSKKIFWKAINFRWSVSSQGCCVFLVGGQIIVSNKQVLQEESSQHDLSHDCGIEVVGHQGIEKRNMNQIIESIEHLKISHLQIFKHWYPMWNIRPCSNWCWIHPRDRQSLGGRKLGWFPSDELKILSQVLFQLGEICPM